MQLSEFPFDAQYLSCSISLLAQEIASNAIWGSNFSMFPFDTQYHSYSISWEIANLTAVCIGIHISLIHKITPSTTFWSNERLQLA